MEDGVCLDNSAECVRGKCHCSQEYFLKDDNCGKVYIIVLCSVFGRSISTNLGRQTLQTFDMWLDDISEKKKDLGSSCNDEDICLDDNALCTEGVCKCKDTFYDDRSGECSEYLPFRVCATCIC